MVRNQTVVRISLLARKFVSFIAFMDVENVLSSLLSELQFMSFKLACQKLEPVRTARFLLVPGT